LAGTTTSTVLLGCAATNRKWRRLRIREAVTNRLDNIAAAGHVGKRDLADRVGYRLPDRDVAVDVAQLDAYAGNSQPFDRGGHHDAPGCRGLRLRCRRLLSAGRASRAERQDEDANHT
jgi:hypothetical protein